MLTPHLTLELGLSDSMCDLFSSFNRDYTLCEISALSWDKWKSLAGNVEISLIGERKYRLSMEILRDVLQQGRGLIFQKQDVEFMPHFQWLLLSNHIIYKGSTSGVCTVLSSSQRVSALWLSQPWNKAYLRLVKSSEIKDDSHRLTNKLFIAFLFFHCVVQLNANPRGARRTFVPFVSIKLPHECTHRFPSSIKTPRENGERDNSTHCMGFPRISDMIALSPPRYSKDRLRKL